MPAQTIAPPARSTSTVADVAIVGAGPAGLALAAAVADAGLTATLVERQPRSALADPAPDGRDIALTHRADAILRALGIRERFPEAEVAPLREARVTDGDSPFALRFDARRTPDGPLGWLVANHVIRRAAFEAATSRPAVSLIDGTGVAGIGAGAAASHGELVLEDGRRVRARLLVAADSRFSTMRRAMGIGARMTDFGRVVIVSRMRHALPNRGIAHECFRHGDTLALLPMNDDRVSAVVTVTADAAPALMAMAPAAFAELVRERSGDRLGAMTPDGERHAYPLVATYAHRFVARRFALIGDAAVGMHPVTAHGFNFGLRGADTLAREIGTARRLGLDIGGGSVLDRYDRDHRAATWPLYTATNALVSLYTDSQPLARIGREALLRLGNALPPVKALMMGKLTEIEPARRLA